MASFNWASHNLAPACFYMLSNFSLSLKTRSSLWTQNFFILQIFSDQNFFGFKIFSDPKFFRTYNFLDQKFFQTKNFLTKNIFRPRYLFHYICFLMIVTIYLLPNAYYLICVAWYLSIAFVNLSTDTSFIILSTW